jgi:hypothetical protein
MSAVTAEEQNIVYDTIETLVKASFATCEEHKEVDGACYWEGLNTDGGLILYSVSLASELAAAGCLVPGEPLGDGWPTLVFVAD